MRVRLVTGLLVLGLGLTGCSEDEPGAGPTLPPVSESPSAEPSATAEPVPTEATDATPEGAAEFARFFYAQVEQAYARRDPEIVRRLSAPGCTACDRFIATLTTLRDQGQRADGLKYEILSAETPPLAADKARVDVVYNSGEAVIYAADGSVVLREPAVEFFNEQVDLVLIDGGWRVQEVTAA